MLRQQRTFGGPCLLLCQVSNHSIKQSTSYQRISALESAKCCPMPLHGLGLTQRQHPNPARHRHAHNKCGKALSCSYTLSATAPVAGAATYARPGQRNDGNVPPPILRHGCSVCGITEHRSSRPCHCFDFAAAPAADIAVVAVVVVAAPVVAVAIAAAVPAVAVAAATALTTAAVAATISLTANAAAAPTAGTVAAAHCVRMLPLVVL